MLKWVSCHKCVTCLLLSHCINVITWNFIPVELASAASCLFHLLRRFWNQIFTWRINLFEKKLYSTLAYLCLSQVQWCSQGCPFRTGQVSFQIKGWLELIDLISTKNGVFIHEHLRFILLINDVCTLCVVWLCSNDFFLSGSIIWNRWE